MPPAIRFLTAFVLAAAPLGAQARELAPALKPYVTVNEPVVALTNARVIDGTGAPVKDGQTILIRGEKIAAVGPAASVTVPAGARTIDLAGKTVIPGIIGLHDHMYYSGMKFMGSSYPRLFLSAGVTTIRTTGSVDAYQELNLKRLSDSLKIVAPTIVVTGPYLQGAGSGFVTMPVLFLAGVLIQHFLIRRVLGQNDLPQIFLTFALSLLIVNVSLMAFTANYRTLHTSYSDEALHFAGLYVPVAKLIAFVVAMALSGVLWAFLQATDLGKAMRAASQNREVAQLMGINPNRVFAVALGIALALAGAAGSLLMPFYSAYPMVGQVFVLMAFVAVVLGTLGNVVGALIASLLMGVAESLGIQFIGADSGLIVVFVLLLATLALRPRGLAAGAQR